MHTICQVFFLHHFQEETQGLTLENNKIILFMILSNVTLFSRSNFSYFISFIPQILILLISLPTKPFSELINKRILINTLSMIPEWVNDYQNVPQSKITAIRSISSIDYTVLSSQDILNQSQAEIDSFQLYDNLRNPTPKGPLDKRLGIGSRSHICSTCQQNLQNCVGHFGHARLCLPIYHLGYFKSVITVLKMICKKCCRVLLQDELIEKYSKKMRALQNNYFNRLNFFKKISKEAMKNKNCPHCMTLNPSIQKIPKICGKIQVKSHQMKKELMDSKIRKGVKVQGSSEGDFIHQLTPWDALKLLRRIPQSEYLLLNIGGKTMVTDFIIQDLPVPPVNIRPSVMLTNSLSNEDDLTMKIKDIIALSKKIDETMIQKGDQFAKIYKYWYLMQSHWSQYINSDAPGLPLIQLKVKSIRSLITRLKGKQGRFRQNLSGKRANFTARTVISPDPNLHPTEVIVPQHMAKILTIQETVTMHSIQKLQQCIEIGSNKRGGANFIITANQKIMIGNNFRSKVQLKFGDIVERHLKDGDVVIFNRQPSLHRMSMMGFRVKVSAGKTLRFNQCVCAPFNADFDGDEMNIHVPQSLQARSQTLHLMGVTENIMTPKSGEPLIALIQDFLTTSFLITSKDVFFSREQFGMILGWITDADQSLELPPPTIMKPVNLWTGKQVISSILRPNRHSKVIVNFETKEKNYKSNGVQDLKDGWVVFRNSEHILGQLGKNTLGGNKNGLIYNLLRDNTNQVACEVMHRIAKLSSRWLSNYGMTIGISDVTPSLKLKSINSQAIQIAYDLYRKYLKDYQRGVLQPKPGMSTAETLQSLLNSTLSKVRETVGDNCIDNLDRYNKPLIMAVCGSKGNAVNLSQMIGCVGQQTVGGKRITYGFTQRTIPHFPRLCYTPEARGFVKNSFFSGLTATQFFFHTMGGREGIIDTAVKTADTGYMQRRLIKLIEDIGVMYDYTVRTCDRKEIIQFRYGDDGLNPMKTQQNINPINLKHLEGHVKSILGNNLSKQFYLSPQEISETVQASLQSIKDKKMIIGLEEPLLNNLLEKVKIYFQEKVQKLSQNYQQIDNHHLNKKVDKINHTYQADKNYLKNCFNGITDRQLSYFFTLYVKKINKAIMEPGQAIGALTAQSIGEPATQMTLKTFHFAGISSMNITQGVPRVNEIINNSKTIATPIITICLNDDIKNSKDASMGVKNLIQKLNLGTILHSIQQIYALKDCSLNLILSVQTLRKLKINISIENIKRIIDVTMKTRIKKSQILDSITLSLVPVTKTNLIFELKSLRRTIVNLPITGIKTIERALISKKDKSSEHIIYAQGVGLAQIFGIQGVNQKKTYSNHITEIQEVLGIQAARQSIINQISETMKEHGVNVNPRHVNLLAQFMTYKGRIIGFTRNGVDKMKDSTLMLASFQKTADFLYDAAVQGKHDRLKGVSQKIIMGQPITVGTGMFDIRQDIPNKCIYGKA